MNSLLKIAIVASVRAGKEIMKIYNSKEIGLTYKNDNSPLTLADNVSNNTIMEFITPTKIPIISEENKQIAYSNRKEWKNCWIVDPLDGTKEFIKRNGEFTVNIALCKNGKPVIGVIYVPVSKELYYADVEKKEAFKAIYTDNQDIITDISYNSHRILPIGAFNEKAINVVASRSHMNEDTKSFIEGLKADYENVQIVSKGSSLKFCLVAEGKANIYPRFAPTMEWDTAAGHAICNAVDLKVISQESNQELVYNRKNQLNSNFIVKK